MSSGLCEGRVVIVTGAGRGIGREYALMLAQHGARVIVNDLGAARDGTPGQDDLQPAESVVQEIRARGGEAIAPARIDATIESLRTQLAPNWELLLLPVGE